MSRRRGFSLIDLLVVVVVVVLLLGLSLSAAKKVWLAENRAKSLNNLKMIGLAVHCVNDLDGIPTVCDFGSRSKTGHGIRSLFFELLPFMDQQNVYALFDAKSPATYYDSKNGAAKTNIATYVSPDDASAEGDVTATAEVIDPNAAAPFAASFSGSYATTSYAANGMFFVLDKPINDTTDGLSQTIMLAERYRVCKRSEKKDDVVYNLWGMGAYGASMASFATAPPSDAKYPTTKPELEQFVPPATVPAMGDIAGHWGTTAGNFKKISEEICAPGGFQVAPRNQVHCDPRVPQGLRASATASMGVCMGDGSARMLNGNMSQNIFWAAVTPAGGETLGEDW